MTEIIYLVVGLVVGYVGGRASQMRQNKSGSSSLNQQRAAEQQKQLDRIMTGFGPDEEITNDRVEQMLGVSDSSVGRYLEELEKSGKLRQVGNTGRGVIYKKV